MVIKCLKNSNLHFVVSLNVSFATKYQSMQSSLFQSRKLDHLSDLDMPCRSSVESQNNEPINLTQYRLPNDLSESFEARVLASLVAQNAHEVNGRIFIRYSHWLIGAR